MKTLRLQMLQQMELKGYSQRTIHTYIQAVSGLAKYYNLSPDLLTIEQIREYIHYCLTEKKLSKTWMNQLVSALKILNCEILKKEWNSIDIPRPRRERTLPIVLSREEVKQIINSLKNVKHRSFLMLTYSAGLRLGEACNLKISDIDSSRMLIRIEQSKGNKDRYVVLSPVALETIRIYWKLYKPKKWLFEGFSHQPISQSSAQKTFKNALKKSGVTKKVGIHSLRHSYATHLLEQGVALPIIQQLLGHKSLRTTSGYLHVQQYSIEKVQSPLDSLLKQ